MSGKRIFECTKSHDFVCWWLRHQVAMLFRPIFGLWLHHLQVLDVRIITRHFAFFRFGEEKSQMMSVKESIDRVT